MNGNDFIGQDVLVQQADKGPARRLFGVELLEKGIPRQGYPCMKGDKAIGTITSGSISPVLGHGIALAYLDGSVHEGEEIDVSVRSKRLKALVRRPPFVQGSISK